MPVQSIKALLVPLGPLFDRFEPLDGGGGDCRRRPQCRQLLAQGSMPMPTIANRGGQIAEVELLTKFILLFLQARQLPLDRVALADEAEVGVPMRLLLFDLPADLLPLIHELRYLAGRTAAIENTVPRRLQFPQDLDQRNTVQAGGDTIPPACR
jgi:hypothetical protein